MSKYEFIIYWSDDDQAYVAECPKLPGCMSDGSTYREALDNLEIIVNEWMETAKKLGREIPSYKSKLS